MSEVFGSKDAPEISNSLVAPIKRRKDHKSKLVNTVNVLGCPDHVICFAPKAGVGADG